MAAHLDRGYVSRKNIIVLFDASETLFDPRNNQLLPGARELVGELHDEKIRMGIVSGSASLQVKALLTINGIAEFFPVVVGHDDSPVHSERLRIAIGKLDFLEQRKKRPLSGVFLIDDRASRIGIAESMGIKFIGVATGGSGISSFESGPVKPYRVFKDLRDTEAIVWAITREDQIRRTAERPVRSGRGRADRATSLA